MIGEIHPVTAKMTKARRDSRGSTLVELPVMLWLLFIVLFIPMLGLASITLRGALMDSVVRDAVHVASKSLTFATSSADGPSATQAAQDTLTNRLSAFPGITASSVESRIVITEISSGTITRSTVPLATVDSSKFIYQLETTARGQIDPLIRGNQAIFGSIPGLSTPMSLEYTAREMFENPQGLNR